MRVSKQEIAENESNSILNQRLLLQSYLNQNEYLSDYHMLEFFDDGVTGANFERPSFERLLTELKKGSINCIMVKDFSRFGRDYIETGEYIEEILPFMGVRFISVNDKFDSLVDNFGLEHQFKTLNNNAYIIDLSNNIKKTFKAKMMNGTFVAGQPLFGYKKTTSGKRRLIVDEEAAEVVIRIFEKAASYVTPLHIAKTLNAEHIPTPSVYRKRRNVYLEQKENFWRTYMIYDILHNERYLGNGIYNKSERVEIASKKTKHLPKEQWITLSHAHDAIVSEELYNKALHCLKYPIKSNLEKKERSLYAKVKCQCCGYSMKRTNATNAKYYCESPKFISSPNCVSEGIFEIDIENAIIKAIQIQVDAIKEKEKQKEIIKKRLKSQKVDISQKIKNLQKSISTLRDIKFKNYELYKEGVLRQDEFINKKSEIDLQLLSYEQQVSDYSLALENDNCPIETLNHQLYSFAYGNEKLIKLSRQLVDELIEKIIVLDSSHFEIVWKITDLSETSNI